MSEMKFINTDEYSSKSQRFDELLNEGIDLVQKYSGNKWTDYNFHDPGITILEQLCYAITDLGYRTNFPIEDILLIKKDNFNLESSNLLFSADKVFSSSPLTINDYKKLIIDSIENVNNAWITIYKKHKLGVQGIFNVNLQLKDNLDDKTVNETISKTRKLLLCNRSISTDLDKINVLKKDIISIVADISIDSFIVGEEILAKIYHKIESKLNSKISFHNYNDEISSGKSIEDLYSGVITKNGHIRNSELVEKTSEIYVSELKEIIKNIDGVLNLKNFEVYKNGIKIFDNVISFSENSYPSLEDVENYFSDGSEGDIKFYRNNIEYEIDHAIFSQLYDTISISNNILLKRRILTTSLNNYQGRFNKEQLEKYYSIINEFPSVYGLKVNELPSNSNDLRVSQVKQLKTYLLLFDQIMANHLSQLSSIRNIFSIDNNKYTYSYQFINEIGEVNDLIKNNNKRDFKNVLSSINENKNNFFTRKNKILDHLLSRFGESYSTSIISKLYQFQNPKSSYIDVNMYALNAKIKYAKNILNLGKNRNLSNNYLYNINDVNNDLDLSKISGIENRLKLLLNLNKNTIYPNFSNFEKGNLSVKVKNKWTENELNLSNNIKINILSLVDSCYLKNRVNFYLENYNSFKDLFQYATQTKYYLVQNCGDYYCILFNSPSQPLPSKIFVAKTKKICQDKINDLVDKFIQLDNNHEGFYMIENILLRPYEKQSKFLIINQDKLIFRSKSVFDVKILNDLRSKLFEIFRLRNNFSIIKINKKYKIFIYDVLDNKILESINLFSSKKECELKINSFINFFNSRNVIINNSKIQEEAVVKNKFPDDFNYSNHISFIFPNWPFRFQNKEFQDYIKSSIKSFIPAHLSFNIHYFNISDMIMFSELYKKWRFLKSEDNIDKTEEISLQIIQLLSK